MIQSFASLSLPLFLVLAIISPFLPLYLVWRVQVLCAVTFIGGQFLQGPIHWSGRGVGSTFGEALLFVFVLFLWVLIALRLAAARVCKQLSYETFAGPKAHWRYWMDEAILGCIGGVAGLLSAGYLASVFAGSFGGVLLDRALGIVAIAGALIVLWRFKRKALGTAFCIVLAAVAFVGSLQPIRIMKQAELLANGRPWCLETPINNQQVTSVKQLGFLSLTKGITNRRSVRNLILFVRDEGSFHHYAYWSIRKQKFIKEADFLDRDPPCTLPPS